MEEKGNLLEYATSTTKVTQEVRVDDKVSQKSFKVKLPLEVLEKLLQEGKFERQTDGCFHATEGILRETENQGILSELETLDTEQWQPATPEEVSSVKNPSQAVFQKRRGRPRKGTYVPRPSDAEQLSVPSISKGQNYKHKQSKKRKYGGLKVYDSTDTENHLGIDQSTSKNKSKRRRQPKILDDYVTDFDTSDEETKSFSSRASASHNSRRGRGRSKVSNVLHSAENDVLAYYLGDFDRKLSEHDIFDDKFLEEIHESNEEESTHIISAAKSPADVSVTELENSVTDPSTSSKTNETLKPNTCDNAGTRKVPNAKAPKSARRIHHPQVAALQQRYYKLLEILQKKPQVNKLIDLVHGASALLNEEQLVFFTLQLKSGCKNLQGVRFSVREKVLALAIYAHSPETYKWMQTIFHLPTKLILDRWLEVIAKNNPEVAKKLIYYVYNKYIFKS